jgi:glycosyltransferase involved in cell wall biosynthesis
MTKSNYHKDVINAGGFITYVVPNGISPLKIKNKKKNLLICTCSPDRCLIGLLKALPLIRREIPDAEIHWAYGFGSGVNGTMETNENSKEWVANVKELIKNTEGFKDLGRLKNINDLYESAHMFIYPTYFPEIDCISLTKAISAGCEIVCTPAGAMSEKLGLSEQIAKINNDTIDYSLSSGPHFDRFINSVINKLKNGTSEINLLKRAEMINKNYNWEEIVNKWEDLLSQYTNIRCK